MPENRIVIQCTGDKQRVRVDNEDLHMCYCEWILAISARSNPLLEREIEVSLYIENLTLTYHLIVTILYERSPLNYDINV